MGNLITSKEELEKLLRAGVLNGVHDNITNEAYHAGPGISKSGLDKIAKSPAHYKMRIQETTEAMSFGSMVHEALLEPEKFHGKYKMLPEHLIKADGNLRTDKASKTERDKLKGDNPELIYLKPKVMEQIGCMIESLWSRDDMVTLFGDTIKEVSAYSVLDGAIVRCRPDAVNNEGMILDIKTTVDASQEAFSRSVWNYRYHVQAAFYMDVYNLACKQTPESRDYLARDVEKFILVAIEKEAPYGVQTFELPQDWIDQGRKEYQANLEIYLQCLETDSWPSYEAGIKTLGTVEVRL